MMAGHKMSDSIPKNFAPPNMKNRTTLIEMRIKLADNPSGFSLGEINVAKAIPTPTKPGIKAQENDQVSQFPVRF